MYERIYSSPTDDGSPLGFERCLVPIFLDDVLPDISLNTTDMMSAQETARA